MKKLAIIFAGFAFAAALTSCNKMEYKTAPFVVFQNTTFNVNEDCGTVSIPVSAYNITEATTIAFNIGGTAVNGTDYTMKNSSATITLTPESTTGTLDFDIVFDKTQETGTRTITVNFESATNNVSVPSATCKVNIADVVVIDWERIERTWVARDYDFDSGSISGEAYESVLTKVSDTEFVISNWLDAGFDLKGTVTFAEDQKSATISITKSQAFDYYGYPIWATWYNGSSLRLADIPGTIDGSGIRIGVPGQAGIYIYIYSGSYAGYGFGAYYTELTMK